MVYVEANDLLVKDPLIGLDDTAGWVVATGETCASCLQDAANNKRANIAKCGAILALQFSFGAFIIVKLIRVTIVKLHKILNFNEENILPKLQFPY